MISYKLIIYECNIYFKARNLPDIKPFIIIHIIISKLVQNYKTNNLRNTTQRATIWYDL
jgi:hypothetical protein